MSDYESPIPIQPEPVPFFDPEKGLYDPTGEIRALPTNLDLLSWMQLANTLREGITQSPDNPLFTDGMETAAIAIRRINQQARFEAERLQRAQAEAETDDEAEPAAPRSPHEDPALLEQAHGDIHLLDRLVAVNMAERLVDQNPGDAGFQQNLDFMREALETYKNTHP
jgi:hypothetical protein